MKKKSWVMWAVIFLDVPITKPFSDFLTITRTKREAKAELRGWLNKTKIIKVRVTEI